MNKPRDLKKIAKGLYQISKQCRDLALFIEFTLKEKEK